MVIQEPVQAAVWQCLNHYAYSDAIFLAERLYAEVGTEEALFLLATCYFRSGKPVRAYALLQQKGCATPASRFLMAQCCLEIDKLNEAEAVLAGSILTKQRNLEELCAEFGDSASYALRLLGRVYSKTDRLPKALEMYKRSLKLNPFLWSSFESLCHLGEKPDSSKIFQVSATTPGLLGQPVGTSPPAQQPSPPPVICAITNSSSLNQPQQQEPPTPMDTVETPVTQAQTLQIVQSENTFSGDSTFETSCLGSIPPSTQVRNRARPRMALNLCSPNQSLNTPSFGFLPLGDTPSPGNSQNTIPFITPSPIGLGGLSGSIIENVQQPPKVKMTRRSQQASGLPATKPLLQSGLQGNVPGGGVAPGGVRRSTRLFSSNNTNPTSSSVKENNKSQSQNKKFTSPRAPAKRSKPKSSKTAELNELNKSELTPDTKPSTITSQQEQMLCNQKRSAEGLMALLGDIGRAYVHLTHYDCAKALQLFSNLPPHHYNTGWVLCQVGRAYFEEVEYQKAVQVFQQVQEQFPYYLEGMEVYSTALWHLQREVELSSLAQNLTELDKFCPETWCATGNCFSLQKEHDTAIKFFQRAVQVDPDFAYAYTLLGHEFVLTEELDKALACFRNALRADSRHYNAWYGIGMIFYKQEKFALAEIHFKKALSINPQSSVLMCHVGVVQHALKKSECALATLNKAIATDPKNPLCKFHKASILFATDRHKEALQELEELKQIVPKESLVYFLIGKVHKKLGNTHLALMNFSWAMDLDPKGANNQIKEAIDKPHGADDDPTAGIDEADFEDLGESSNNSSLLLADDVQLQADETDQSF